MTQRILPKLQTSQS